MWRILGKARIDGSLRRKADEGIKKCVEITKPRHGKGAEPSRLSLEVEKNMVIYVLTLSDLHPGDNKVKGKCGLKSRRLLRANRDCVKANKYSNSDDQIVYILSYSVQFSDLMTLTE